MNSAPIALVLVALLMLAVGYVIVRKPVVGLSLLLGLLAVAAFVFVASSSLRQDNAPAVTVRLDPSSVSVTPLAPAPPVPPRVTHRPQAAPSAAVPEPPLQSHFEVLTIPDESNSWTESQIVLDGRVEYTAETGVPGEPARTTAAKLERALRDGLVARLTQYLAQLEKKREVPLEIRRQLRLARDRDALARALIAGAAAQRAQDLAGAVGSELAEEPGARAWRLVLTPAELSAALAQLDRLAPQPGRGDPGIARQVTRGLTIPLALVILLLTWLVLRRSTRRLRSAE